MARLTDIGCIGTESSLSECSSVAVQDSDCDIASAVCPGECTVKMFHLL